MARSLAIVLALIALLVPATGQAQAVDHNYRPTFRPFNSWDYLGTGAVLGGYYVVELTQEGPRGADWTKPLPLDRPLRDWIVADGAEARDQAHSLSDVLWYASVAFPVTDAIVTPAIRTRGAYVSWQMTMMNLQSFAVISLLVRMPHKWLGRTRPDSIGCTKDERYSRHCNKPGLFVSFPGGHVGVSMTGAGLSCAHHLHGALYGSKMADGIACGAALTAAAMVGYFRMRADAHWFSDQVTGTTLGLFSGYLLPTLLYYHPFWRSGPAPRQASGLAPRWSLSPLLGQNSLGATLVWLD